jgi:hypothetical protein
MVRDEPMVAVPEPKLRSWVPAKVKFWAIVILLLFASVMALVLVLSIVVAV